MNISWRFPPSSGGPIQGYTNNDIEAFKGEELIDNLAREVCQNSLDAHDPSCQDPVRVVFELKQIPTSKYDVFSGYEACLRGCRAFWSQGGKIDAKLDAFLSEAEKVIKRPSISVLIASDYHTKGLCGSRNLNSNDTPWTALTGADGVSVKSDDNSGGSFGIGKNAPFACSSLSMVFYNTWDSDDNRAFIGVGRLATLLNNEGKATQRTGYYQNNDDASESWLPIYQEDTNEFRDLFNREEKGTDIIIAGFNEVENWNENIAKAVIKNFFVAVKEKRLVVEIVNGDNTNKIDHVSIEKQIEAYAKNDSELEITRQLYSAYNSPDIEPVYLTVLGEENAVEIFVKSDASFQRSIANFRSTGMLVGKGYRRIFQHYAAVMIVRGEKLGEILRDCEPPRHNRWDYKLIKGEANKEKRKNAKAALSYLDNELLRLLKSRYETVAGDSTDAPGVSEYLPDADDGAIPTDSDGKDILKVKIKIGKPKTNKPQAEQLHVPGTNGEGTTSSFDSGNRGSRNGPLPTPPGPYPGPGPGPVPGPNPGESPDPAVTPGGNNTQRGVMPGDGSRVVSTKELSKRRSFPIAPNLGLYKAVLFPTRTYDNLYVECTASGEDGKPDRIAIHKLMYQGKAIPCNKGKAGPIQIVENESAELMITLDKCEKMGLGLILTEGCEQNI